nr:hypothetical protein CFP56_04005 [Quercus suber]
MQKAETHLSPVPSSLRRSEAQKSGGWRNIREGIPTLHAQKSARPLWNPASPRPKLPRPPTKAPRPPMRMPSRTTSPPLHFAARVQNRASPLHPSKPPL